MTISGQTRILALIGDPAYELLAIQCRAVTVFYGEQAARHQRLHLQWPDMVANPYKFIIAALRKPSC